MKQYAILVGRKNRYITKDYQECLSLVHKYPGAKFKSFPTWIEAAEYLEYDLDPDKDYSEFPKRKNKH